MWWRTRIFADFLAWCALSAAGAPIPLLSSAIAHVFTGQGGLSAGASSRLLRDYAPAIREDILDFLFLPKWGLGLNIIKVEIGGDAQSTDGTEPSHQHERGDLNCTRGYELDLMKSARARNPGVKTYGLSWGAPGWINNGTFFGPEMVAYQTKWLQCMAAEGVQMDYIGVCAYAQPRRAPPPPPFPRSQFSNPLYPLPPHTRAQGTSATGGGQTT
jgi:hypothetical protein